MFQVKTTNPESFFFSLNFEQVVRKEYQKVKENLNIDDNFINHFAIEKITKLEIGLHTICNYDCIFCFNHSDKFYNLFPPVSLDYQFIYNLVRNSSLPIESIYFSSTGEPFLWKNLKKLVDLLIPHVKNFGFSTNGYLLDKATIDFLKDIPTDKIYVSIDAGDADTYEKIRRGGKFSTVVNNTHRLSKVIGNEKIIFAAVVFNKNKESVLKLPKIASEIGIKEICFFRLHCHPRMKERDIKPLTDQEVIDFVQKAEEVSSRYGVKISISPALLKPHLRKKVDVKAFFFDNLCNDPFTYLSIHPTRKSHPCCGPFKLQEIGYAENTDIGMVFNRAEKKILRLLMISGNLPHPCRNYCGIIQTKRIDSKEGILMEFRKQLLNRVWNIKMRRVDFSTLNPPIFVRPFGSVIRKLKNRTFLGGISGIIDRSPNVSRYMNIPVLQPQEFKENLRDFGNVSLIIASESFLKDILAEYFGNSKINFYFLNSNLDLFKLEFL